MKVFLKILSICGVGTCCYILFLFGQIQLLDGYIPIKPGITTCYSDKYDEGRFDSIAIGTDTSIVIGLIGHPLEISYWKDAPAIWYFTMDCGQGAWLGRELEIENGKVKYLSKTVHYD